jgi:4-hydroxyproline epimerase
MERISVIDSHTGGEPTRVVVAGAPDLGPGTVADRARIFCEKYDSFRSTVVNEPRGSDVIVGALLVKPADPTCSAGVIFFNNVGLLGMCGHGTIGLAVTLAHFGRIGPGEIRIETPVGVVTATLHDANRATIRNVPSFRVKKNVPLDVPEYGLVHGDIAWGGNWFFLVSDHREELVAKNVERLTSVTKQIRAAIGGEIDHIELFGPPANAANHSRNFVLCPGSAYDRSPCGTGTSAKLACLAADGKLKPGETWRQESIIGSVFEGGYEPGSTPDTILPWISGTAHITAEATLLVDPADPFATGFGA